MRRLVVVIVLALSVGLVGAPGATAGKFYSNAAGTWFSGFERATSTYSVWNSAHTAQYTIGCLHQSYTGVKPGGTSSVLDVAIQPSACSINIGGVPFAVTPEVCAGPVWQFGVGTYNPTTGAGSGQMANCDAVVFHIDALDFCSIVYRWVGSSVGSMIQDRNALDTANGTHPSAGGMRVKWVNFSMPYRTACPGIEAVATGVSSGEGFIPGVWAGP